MPDPMFPFIEDNSKDREKRERSTTQRFWVFWVPLGFVAALVLSMVTDSGEVFLPAWGVSVIVLWAFDREGK